VQYLPEGVAGEARDQVSLAFSASGGACGERRADARSTETPNRETVMLPHSTIVIVLISALVLTSASVLYTYQTKPYGKHFRQPGDVTQTELYQKSFRPCVNPTCAKDIYLMALTCKFCGSLQESWATAGTVKFSKPAEPSVQYRKLEAIPRDDVPVLSVPDSVSTTS
jgi:hypothetical protein